MTAEVSAGVQIVLVLLLACFLVAIRTHKISSSLYLLLAVVIGFGLDRALVYPELLLVEHYRKFSVMDNENLEKAYRLLEECHGKTPAATPSNPYDKNWWYDLRRRGMEPIDIVPPEMRDSIDIMKSETPHYRPEGKK